MDTDTVIARDILIKYLDRHVGASQHPQFICFPPPGRGRVRVGVESKRVTVILRFTPIPTFPLKGEGDSAMRQNDNSKKFDFSSEVPWVKQT